MAQTQQVSSRLTSVRGGNVHGIAGLVLAANSARATLFVEERLKDGRISSRFTNCVGGEFRVRLVSGDADFEAKGTSFVSEDDATSQAATAFAAWEHQQAVARGGDAVQLDAPCF